MPRPELADAYKRPPCDSTIERLIARPIPVPCGLVVKNTSKILSPPTGSPVPASLTEMSGQPCPSRCDRMTSSPVVLFIAPRPLTIRLIKTCCNCTRSPEILGKSASSFVRTEINRRSASSRIRNHVSLITSLRSMTSRLISSFLKKDRVRVTISAARLAPDLSSKSVSSRVGRPTE